MKTLHIVANLKFLSHIFETAEAVNPGANRYVAFTPPGESSHGLSLPAACHVQSGPLRLDEKVREDLRWCDALFLHPLFDGSCPAVDAAPPDTVVVWCGMGADYCWIAPRYQTRQFLPHTRKARRGYAIRTALTTLSVAKLLKRLPWRIRRDDAEDPMQRVAPRVDFFSALERGLELERTLPAFRARYVGNFGYYSLERALSAGSGPVEGPDILVGNSAAWTNNHFDLFEQMRGLDLDGRMIVLPLSYGDSRYADSVERRAIALFGRERVRSLRDWMPIEEYNRTLSRCGTVFMNHVRGQGMGNISSMLYRGAKVYLRHESPYAELFEGLGARFGRIGNGPFDASVFEALTDQEKASNAAVMRDYWTLSAVRKRTRALFDIIAQEVDRRRNADRNRGDRW